MVYKEPDIKKQRFRVRYWVVTYKFFFLLFSREKFVDSLISVPRMAWTVYETDNCDGVITKAIDIFLNNMNMVNQVKVLDTS